MQISKRLCDELASDGRIYPSRIKRFFVIHNLCHDNIIDYIKLKIAPQN
jgi:hypothetical protein